MDHLRLSANVAFDIRGHAFFLEDGTETSNTLVDNLIVVVRPVWSLLLVDQSPAAYWVVNPQNRIENNVAAGSSHYGFWYRALPEVDGVSGQAQLDSGIIPRSPMFTPLGTFDRNVAHSTGKYGLKLNQYFPSTKTRDFSVPAVFLSFTTYETAAFAIWAENLVDVRQPALLRPLRAARRPCSPPSCIPCMDPTSCSRRHAPDQLCS